MSALLTSLPTIPMPWSVTENKYANDTVQYLTQVCRMFGLLETEADRKKLEGVCRCSTHMLLNCQLEGAFLGSLVYLWLFYIDDIFDDDLDSMSKEKCKEIIDRTIHILKFGTLPSGCATGFTPVEKLGLLMRQWAVDLASGKSHEVLHRLLEGCVEYVEHIIPAVTLQQKPTLGSLDELHSLRSKNMAVRTIMSLHELVSGIHISNDEINSPAVLRMQDITGLVLGVTNDIYSYNREVLFLETNQVNKKPINSVYLRAQTKSLAEAVDDAVQQLNVWFDEYNILKESLLPLVSSRGTFQTYCQGMENCMAGNKIWSENSSRYVTSCKEPK